MDGTRLEALKTYFSRRPELGVASVYLFGSHAEGREHRESDVDLGVLLRWDRHSTDRDRFEARIRLSAELVSVLHCNEVDVVILNDAPPLLGRRIIYEGVRVFLGDSATDHAYVRDVQIRAADLAPWLAWVLKAKLEALTR